MQVLIFDVAGAISGWGRRLCDGEVTAEWSVLLAALPPSATFFIIHHQDYPFLSENRGHLQVVNLDYHFGDTAI
jgi:hypothetical protein